MLLLRGWLGKRGVNGKLPNDLAPLGERAI